MGRRHFLALCHHKNALWMFMVGLSQVGASPRCHEVTFGNEVGGTQPGAERRQEVAPWC